MHRLCPVGALSLQPSPSPAPLPPGAGLFRFPLAPLPPRASPLPIRPACSAPAAHFAAYSAASTPDVSRETSVLAPRLAHDSGSSSMPPLTVEASVGSRSAVTFPPPDVRQNRRFGSPSSDFAVTGHRRHGFGRQNPRSGFPRRKTGSSDCQNDGFAAQGEVETARPERPGAKAPLCNGAPWRRETLRWGGGRALCAK